MLDSRVARRSDFLQEFDNSKQDRFYSQGSDSRGRSKCSQWVESSDEQGSSFGHQVVLALAKRAKKRQTFASG